MISSIVLALVVTGRQWSAPMPFCELLDEDVSESSGVAPSMIQDDVYYTHNDSGDKPRFFRFNVFGTVTGVYTLKGAKAIDWEDMASARVKGKNYLFFGDIGDNLRKRDHVTVYRVKEPTVGGVNKVAVDETYRFKYPDGAHDCEALFVTSDGAVWLVTKESVGESRVYTARASGTNAIESLALVGKVRTDTRGFGGKLVTGADLSADARHIMLRTYTGALEFAVPKQFRDWVSQPPTRVKTATEKQGEAICYSRDGRSLVTTSEYVPCKVSFMSLLD